MVLNLVRNAMEAVQDTDRREIVVTTMAPVAGQTAEVRATEMGPGLAPEISSKLFQPFVSTKLHGMGLGLSICREIVEGRPVSASVASLRTWTQGLPAATSGCSIGEHLVCSPILPRRAAKDG